MEWNGGKIEDLSATHVAIKSQSYCKPCKQHSGHPSMGGACTKEEVWSFFNKGVDCIHTSSVLVSIH